ncbi:MAG TPA: DEAD/DEAH box helicase family protein, partial [Pseudomonadales bacterium]|nr:DEAD/DEAH box helicase family protein [Pseudomonadales bacterium]
MILQVALPVPLRRLFDYLPPENTDLNALSLGVRVRVGFGRQTLIGVLIAIADHSDVPANKLKPAQAILDVSPPFTPVLFEIAQWAARYYQYPLGEVFYSLLPHTLREGKNNQLAHEQHWRAVVSETHALRANSKLLALYQWLLQDNAAREDILAAGYTGAQIKTLHERGLIESFFSAPTAFSSSEVLAESPLALNEEQRVAVAGVSAGKFSTTLLEGVTGSGKTEVYLQLIEKVLARGEQALVLVPEIGLTPQTVSRFRRRFHCPVLALHSGLADGERYHAWRRAQRGEAGIVIGTRSAL